MRDGEVCDFSKYKGQEKVAMEGNKEAVREVKKPVIDEVSSCPCGGLR